MIKYYAGAFVKVWMIAKLIILLKFMFVIETCGKPGLKKFRKPFLVERTVLFTAEEIWMMNNKV